MSDVPAAPRRVVFLDFDGVLNSDAFFARRQNRYRPEELDEDAVARLATLVARTGAVVVVSSTWRLGYSLEDLRRILAKHGFAEEVAGVTPVIEHEEERFVRQTPRGLEIQAWLDAQPEPPEAFVILDDQADMEHLADRLVQTDLATGLEDAHVEAAVVLLLGSDAPGAFPSR
jgi:hypothetical protein